MRKSQVAGQVFTYVLAAVIFAFVIIYGYKAITGFIEKGEEIKLIQLKTGITTSARKISTSSDIRKLELHIPSKYDSICLINSYPDGVQRLGIPALTSDFARDYPLIYDSWDDNVQQDVFLVPHSDFEIFVGNMRIGDPGAERWLCLNSVSGRVALRLEGIGDGVKVTRWS